MPAARSPELVAVVCSLPIKHVGGRSAQIGTFMTFVYAVRRMARAGWPGFSTGGVLWFPDLRQAARVRHRLDAVPPGTAGGGGGSPAGGAGDLEGFGAVSGDRGSLEGDARDPGGAGLLRGGGEGAAEGAGGLEGAEPLGDILVYYPMGNAGLVLPAAVCAAMALQIHWASSRSAVRAAQERGEPCAWGLSQYCDALKGPLAVACVAAQCAATGMPAHAPAGSPRCVCVL